jgi:hypothetical protein
LIPGVYPPDEPPDQHAAEGKDDHKNNVQLDSPYDAISNYDYTVGHTIVKGQYFFSRRVRLKAIIS